MTEKTPSASQIVAKMDKVRSQRLAGPNAESIRQDELARLRKELEKASGTHQ